MPQIKDRLSLLIGNLWEPNEANISYLREQYSDLPAVKIKSTISTPKIESVTIPKTSELAKINHLETKLQHTLVKNPTHFSPSQVAENSFISNNAEIRDQSATTTPSNRISDLNQLITNWEELEQAALNCDKCKLCYGRTHVVIDRGSRAAKWMFIGEGPGEQEDLQGRPFVGASGQLLDKMIQAMSLNSQTEVYIANVIKCRPPHNRNPEEEEIRACSNYLFSQINLVKPSIIITLGRFAAQTLLQTDLAVGKLRNKVHLYQHTPVIVTYHPSYLLRTPGAKKDAWSDLQLAIKTFFT